MSDCVRRHRFRRATENHRRRSASIARCRSTLRHWFTDCALPLWGLAIPEGAFYARLSPKQQIVISAAGPGIQLVAAALLIVLLWMGNFSIPTDELLLRFVESLSGSRNLPYAGRHAVGIALFVNVYWAVLNLAPVWPLDGGKISKNYLRCSTFATPFVTR